LSQPQVSISGEDKLINFITGSTESNKFDYSDTVPFTNLKWVKENLSNGKSTSDVNSNFDTRKTLNYSQSRKTITNFDDGVTTGKVKPFTNFLLETPQEPQPIDENQTVDLQYFYLSRFYKPDKQVITEGNIRYKNYSGYVSEYQTTSMLNTPYFINAIQDGLVKFRNFDKYPFVAAAYLFLNSLPLSTLKERYKTYSNNQAEDLDYIFASLKKFGALHKVPYAWVLKIGSVWHRYKNYIENSTDILDNSWKNFDSLTNYDPGTSALTKTYSLTYKNSNIDIILEDINVLGSQTSTIINTGFYPKLINDFNTFLQGFEIIKTNTQVNGVCSVNGTTLTVKQINGGLLQVGNILAGLNLEPNTTIVSFLNGATGDTGDYQINIAQTATTSLFSVTNVPFGGFTSASINDAFNSGLTLNYVSDSIIDWTNADQTQSVRVIPWSITINTFDNNFAYLIPSSGTLVNQAKFECFDSNLLKVQLTGNTSLHNGAVRLFWTSPNYGYYSNNNVVKPAPSDYIKQIFSGQSIQENFSISDTSSKYSKIEDMFSVFEKSVLDGFEKEFLRFSKSVYDTDDMIGSSTDPLQISELIQNNPSAGIQNQINQSSGTVSEKNVRNFQAFMREMMKLPLITGNTGSEVVSKYQSKQFEIFNSYIKQFMDFDVYFKYGNPSNYDKKLFYSFSNLPLVDSYEWDKYTTVTPNAVPINGGGVTLLTSRTNYPEVWKTLETYVGFSTIPELVYSNNGSYITDFFVDMNVAFTDFNIKQFAKIIKMYATQKLNQFQSNTIAPPVPIPSTPTTIIAFALLKNLYTISIESIEPKKRAIYKSPEGVLLFEGSWSFGTINDVQKLIDEVIIGAYGSTTTNPNDPQYIVSLQEVDPPIYDPIPNSQNKNGLNTFFDNMTTFLNGVEDFQGKILNVLIPKLQKDLPDVNNTVEPIPASELTGEPQPKVELWEAFKALNDKWIAGNDFKNKTLFEDVLLLDRASRNIGDKVLIDIFKLRDTLSSIPPKVNMLSFVQTIIIENNFVVMNIPSYVNFYNVQEATKNPKPRVEGTTDFANTLFGTFLNVDYRDSSAKMVCFYGGKPSEQLDIKNVDYRFRNDAFEMRRVSDNPLLEDQIGKTDWDKSNKVVGFNVDIGPQNQSVFKTFSVGQNQGQATAESLEILNQMANQGGNRGGSTQNVSLYNLYKNRSYSCQVSMIGNALIQPTMYFNLRNVPMFSGPYMILEVNHQISPGNFNTDFRGIRQPTASLPKIDNYLQALRTNLISKIDQVITQEKDAKTAQNPTNIAGLSSQAQTQLSTNSNTINGSQTCTPTVTRYERFVNESPARNLISSEYVRGEVITSITSIPTPENLKVNRNLLAIAIFAKIYIGSRSSQKNNFQAYGFNFIGLQLNLDWGDLTNYTSGKFFCSNNNTPFLIFENFPKNVEFLNERWRPRMDGYRNLPSPNNETEIINFITKFVIVNGTNNNSEGETFYNKLVQDGTIKDYLLVVSEAYKLWFSISNR